MHSKWRYQIWKLRGLQQILAKPGVGGKANVKNSVSENRTECIRQAKIVHEWHGHREFLASSNLENSRQYLLLRKHVLRKTGRATR